MVFFSLLINSNFIDSINSQLIEYDIEIMLQYYMISRSLDVLDDIHVYVYHSRCIQLCNMSHCNRLVPMYLVSQLSSDESELLSYI